MRFFKKISEGWKLFKQTVRFLFKKPIFLIPLFISWIVVAVVVLYNRYYFPEIDSLWLNISYVYLLITIMSFSIILSNSIMLQLIKQYESDEDESFLQATGDVMDSTLLKIIPVAIVWSLLWMLILILKALTSEKEENKAEPSIRDAGRTLSGMNSPFSFLRLGLNMIEKVIRMIVFMTLPAIVWDNKSPTYSVKKSFRIIKNHPIQFLTSYSLTFGAGLLLSLPFIPIYILSESDVVLPSMVWVAVIIYAGIVWTLEMYLEQMTVASLYLWNLKWEEEGGQGDLSSVEKPSIFTMLNE